MSSSRNDGGRRRRILVLAPFAPRLDARHGGARVIAALLRGLARRNEVALIHARAVHEEGPDDAVRAACALIEEVELPQRRLRRTRLLASLARGEPPWAAEWRLPAMAERVRTVAERWRPDVVQAEFHVMAQYLLPELCDPARTVVVLHEPGLRSAEARRSLGGPGAALLATLDARAWRRYDRNVVAAADAVVVFADEDRAALSALSDRPVVRVPLGVDVPERANPLGGSRPSVLFVGSYRHPPNVHAARRLATAIMPLVRRRHPGVLLHLVGEQPPRSVRRLEGGGVAVSGWLPDLRPALDAATVVTVPVALGGGVRLKLVEALAAGKATVASPLAAAGLEVVDGRDLLLAETDVEFAERITSLLESEARRAELAAGARRWAERQPGWDETVTGFESVYDDLLRNPSRVTENTAVGSS